MKIIYERILAILIICIPGIVAIYGWTLIRDSIFNSFATQSFTWLPFLSGCFLLIVGLIIVGGFIFHRDKKRNKIQPKLLRKNKQD